MSPRSTKSPAKEITPFRLLFPTIELIVPTGAFLVGREKRRCDVIIRRDSVSRVHCVLTATPTSLEIRDLQSQNGVFVNGHRVHQCDLHENDRIRVGTARFSVAVDRSSDDGDPARSSPTADGRSATGPSEQTPRRPSVGDLSRDSIEIPAASLDDDSFDELPAEDLKVAAAVVEEVHNTVVLSEPPRPKETKPERQAPPAPLPRRKSSGVDDDPPPEETSDAATSDAGQPLHPLLATTAGRAALVLIVGWTAYLILSTFSGGRGRDRDVVRQLTRIGEDVRRLREESATQDVWDKLQSDLESELDATIKYLEKHASNDDPAKQHLLRAARDCLPRMLGVSTKPGWHEERYHEYLGEARRELNMK